MKKDLEEKIILKNSYSVLTTEDSNPNKDTFEPQISSNQDNIRNIKRTKKTNKKVIGPKKACIISDSICKPINMIKFGKLSRYPNNIKRAFPGITATHLKHLIKPIVLEDNPTTIIISAGTNDITKSSFKTGEEIFNGIMECVEECETNGVKNIYVSGLTCRPAYQEKVNIINNFIRENAHLKNYTYIDNANIKARHLWKDKLHHNIEGTNILENNFLQAIHTCLSYESIWD